MKLEVGKRYLTRDGKKVGPIESGERDYCDFVFWIPGVGRYYWNSSGACVGHGERCDNSIAKEYVPLYRIVLSTFAKLIN